MNSLGVTVPALIVGMVLMLALWIKVLMLALSEEDSNDRMLWGLIVFFGVPFGVILYWLVRLPQRRQEERREDQRALQELREELERLP